MTAPAGDLPVLDDSPPPQPAVEKEPDTIREPAKPAPETPREACPPLPFKDLGTAGSPPKRTLPTKWRWAIAGAAALLTLAVIGAQIAKSKKETPRIQTEGDYAVSQEDLRRRKAVSPADFGSRLRPAAPAASAPPIGSSITSGELAERRARREDDPEDLQRLRARGPSQPSAPTVAANPARPLYLTPTTTEQEKQDEREPRDRSRADRGGAVLATAGMSLEAELEGPLVLAGGSSSVVARVVEEGPLHRARFLGVATYSGDRVTLQFRSLILDDGAEYAVRAEAQDQEGTFGLAAGAGRTTEPSVEADVAADTGTDLVAGAIGGLGGAAVGDYARRKRQSGRGLRSSPVVRLEAGIGIRVFLHETIRAPQ